MKSWPVSFRKTGETALPQFCVGIFECPSCKSRFRSRVASPAETAEPTNVKEAVEKIRGIREGFMQTLKELREKIKTLETQRSTMMVEIDRLKKAAEVRANALQDEVNELREEIKLLRELLGSENSEAS